MSSSTGGVEAGVERGPQADPLPTPFARHGGLDAKRLQAVSNFRPLPISGERTLVLGLDPHLLAANLSLAGSVLVACGRECEFVGLEQEPEYVSFVELCSPIPSRTLKEFAPTAVVVNTLRGSWPGPILAAARYGARRFFLVDAPGSFFEVNSKGAFHLTGSRAALRTLARVPGSRHLEHALRRRLDPPWPSLEAARRAASEIAAHARAQPLKPLAEKLRIVHLLGTLGPGGAERQLTYLAEGTLRAGQELEVWISHSLEGPNGHYAPQLRALGVRVRVIEQRRRAELRPRWLDDLGLPTSTLRQLEEHVAADSLIPLIKALVEDPPDILHCWLDHTNLTGGLAGLVAGVPRILLSARNVSPAHVPRLLEPWFRETYRAIATCPSLSLVANSHAGADDYAEWSETDRDQWHVVTNGFDIETLCPMTPEERAAARKALGVAPDEFLVVGVFRLASEKRPVNFLEVIRALKARLPRLRVLHVGSGELGVPTKALAAKWGLEETLSFAGRRDNPWEILGAADASLLTSEIEGLPNVSLESQALEVPIVLTRAGGAPESVEQGVTGYVCEIGDIEGICARLADLAQDPELRKRMGEAGRKRVAEVFSVKKMIESTLALYR